MEKLTISYHDTETDEVIVRDMTAAEVKKHERSVAERDQYRQEQLQIAVDKAALLAKLGITDDEAKLLLS